MDKHSRGDAIRLVAGALAAPVPFAFPNIVLGQTARPRLRIAAIPSEIGSAAYYAKELGYFDKAGIDADVSTMSNGGAISAAILGGSLEFGFSNPISLETAHEKGLPLTIVAGAGVHEAKSPTDGIFTVAATSSIRSAKDCEGKTIAVSGIGNITNLSIRNWIDRNGGDSKLSKYVEIPLPQMAVDILAGRVDGGTMDAVGYAANGGKEKLRQVASTFDAYAPRFLASLWFTSNDFVIKNPALTKQFVSIIRQASAWANSHPKESLPMYVKFSKYTLEQLQSAVRPLFATSVTPELIQPTIEVAAKYGVLKASFPAKDFISPLAE